MSFGYELVVFDSTRPKHRSCGWVPVISSPNLTSPRYMFCRRTYECKIQHGTLALLLTVISLCQRTSLQSAVVGTTSCGNCGLLFDRCQRMQAEHWPRLSSLVAWTTATRCSSAYLTVSYAVYSRFKTPPPVSSPVLSVATTLSRCSISCTGFLFDSESTSKSRHSSIGRSLVTPPPTLPTTVVLSPTFELGPCVQQTLVRAWSPGLTPTSVTEPLRLPVRASGTACQYSSDRRTYRTASSGGY